MSCKDYIINIDCGSSSFRSIVFDVKTGKKVNVSQEQWYRESGEKQYFDTEKNWKLICKCIRNSIRNIDKNRIIGITATSFRHGFVCIDKQGEVIFACTNTSKSSEEEIRFLNESGLSEKIYKIGGDWPSVHALPVLLWLKKEKSEIYENIWKILMISDWIIFKLSGKTFTEPANASSTLLFNVKNRNWSEEIIEEVGLNRDILPECVDGGTVIGNVTPEVSGYTDLNKSTPVLVGLADTQAGLIGIGAIEDGKSSIIAGTFWLCNQLRNEHLIDKMEKIRTQNHCLKDIWMYETCIFLPGASVRWFKDSFCKIENFLEKEFGYNAYDLLNMKAKQVPVGSNGIQVTFSDVTNVKNWKHASPSFLNWDVLASENSGPEVFYRAILENIAYVSYGDFLNINDVCGNKSERVYFSGGGSYSILWAKILADVLNTEIVLMTENECTSLGAFIMSSYGLQVYKNIEDAVADYTSERMIIKPNRENNLIYMDLYKKWREIYKNSLEAADRNLTKYMWKAAGI